VKSRLAHLPRLPVTESLLDLVKSMCLTLRRVLGVAGTALLGGALAWAPVAAFTGEMLTVTKAALVGVALLIVMRILPRRD